VSVSDARSRRASSTSRSKSPISRRSCATG
jgi:hypothetical protein